MKVIQKVGNRSTSQAVSYRRGKILQINYCEILKLSKSRVITCVVQVGSIGQNVDSFGKNLKERVYLKNIRVDANIKMNLK